MKKLLFTILFLICFSMGYSQTKITLSANGKTITATLVENSATEALLKIMPVTIEMSPYGGFEVVGALPQSLPTTDSQITTDPGDIMLYQGNQLVIFYGSNSWSYTRIGKIDDATSASVKDFLGNGNLKVTLSLDNAGIASINKEQLGFLEVFDLNGRKVNPENICTGLYVVNGKMIRVR